MIAHNIELETPSNLDTSVFEAVIESHSVADRLELTRQLCDLVLSSDTSAVDRRQVLPCLIKLACDTDKDIRTIIATRLSGSEHLSADLIFAIIADDDDTALPFIRINPSIAESEMMAILTVGDEKRCEAVAMRADVSAGAVRKIMNEGGEQTVLTLMRNDAVRLGTGYCRKLYNRFHGSKSVCAALMNLPNLPAEIALVHNQRQAQEMRKAAELKGWVADSRSDDYIADQEEINALKIISEVEPSQLQAIVALMSERGMLTTCLLLRAGINGHLPFFEWALAYLSNMSLRKVRSATARHSQRAVNSVLRRSGIPSNAHAIVRAVCQVAAATGSAGKQADADAFGRAMVEVIMTRCAADDVHDRQNIITILAQLTQGRTQTLVSRIGEGISRVA